MPLILIIEDELPIRKFLRASLTDAGFSLIEADTAGQGLRLAPQKSPDLVLLDLGLPDRDGLEVIERLRNWSKVPIIVLSARGLEMDKVAALDAGADDYVTKPFSVAELLARMRVALRHAARVVDPTAIAESRFSVGTLEVDFTARSVLLDHKPVHLTKLEYELLSYLVRHAGKVVTHRFLLEEVWGRQAASKTQSLRVLMASLRRKIEPNPSIPRYLLTEQGVGYRLSID